jgi:hypothetical protein
MVAAGTGEPLPAEAFCGMARKTPSCNRCGAGKRAVDGREPEAAIVLIEPQDSTTCGEGRAAASFVRSGRLLPGECREFG